MIHSRRKPPPAAPPMMTHWLVTLHKPTSVVAPNQVPGLPTRQLVVKPQALWHLQRSSYSAPRLATLYSRPPSGHCCSSLLPPACAATSETSKSTCTFALTGQLEDPRIRRLDAGATRFMAGLFIVSCLRAAAAALSRGIISIERELGTSDPVRTDTSGNPLTLYVMKATGEKARPPTSMVVLPSASITVTGGGVVCGPGVLPGVPVGRDGRGVVVVVVVGGGEVVGTITAAVVFCAEAEGN
mmetsp:Transcript_24906/g.59831  ORF Transcript_24906/g.59831 Transcript_24906/m.59831 type:complete len:242 (+) Transcript_24906:159-884(+)|eukprot:CAMPEP_0172054740 /NCGR_PEP_ID=MMETSP1043-20130122/4906_1 /TAXON_ID=464988 /ORGANISM="Hemiselmis andersenii, Strain CCMP441" /LENGTH=241 /DNA_ID=CAMNT_0012714087 /DNA_START=123 /DNA_END=848 /DNA_ORIENTATION=-